MSTLVLVLNMLAEATTTEQDFNENREVAIKGGSIVGNARKENEFYMQEMIAHGSSFLVDTLVTTSSKSYAGLFSLNYGSLLAFSGYSITYLSKYLKERNSILNNIDEMSNRLSLNQLASRDTIINPNENNQAELLQIKNEVSQVNKKIEKVEDISYLSLRRQIKILFEISIASLIIAIISIIMLLV